MFPSTRAFRILYSTLYYALYLILLGVLIVTPADLMRQAVMHRNNTNVLIIAASYLVTILFLLAIYFGRLYINRSVLASIPKGWIPVDKSDGVPRKVREVIVGDLSRSAAIAWGARPRVEVQPGGSRVGTGGMGAAGGSRGTTGSHVDGGVHAGTKEKGIAVVVVDSEQKKRPHHRIISKLRRGSCVGGGGAIGGIAEKDGDIATAAAVASVGIIPPKDPASPPVWGEIEHPGWASPTSPDLPNLQYNAVISELPNLIEAKALTLAPLDPESRTDPPALDPDAVAVLQRPETMGLREYLVQLTEIEVLTPAVVGPFISQYEAARFSTRPVLNQQLRQLMHLFAELLRGMQPLDPAVLLDEYDDDDDGDGDYASAIYDTDIDNDGPRGSSSSSLGEEDGRSRRGNNNNLRDSNNDNLLNDNNVNTTTTGTTTANNIKNNTNNLLIARQKSSSSRSTSSADSMSSQRRYSTATRNSNLGLPPGTGTLSGRNTPLSSSMLRNSSANTWQHSQTQTFRTAPTTPKSRRTVGTFEDDDDADGRRSRSFSSNRTGSTAADDGSGSRRSTRNRKTNTSSRMDERGSTAATTRRKGTSTRRKEMGDGGEEIEMDSFAQTRHPYVPGESSNSSGSGSASQRSGNSGSSSGRSSGKGSVVIRLASGEEESSSGLPYYLGFDELGRGTAVVSS